MHDDLRDIAKRSPAKGLREVVQRGKEKWTAHVTLGDLRGGGRSGAKKEILKELAKLLEDGLGFEESCDNIDTVQVRGVAMGGPVPPQVDLNWDFSFDK